MSSPGNQTTYASPAIQTMANRHRDFASTLDGQMNTLQSDIQQTLAKSRSDMTHALDSTFEEFRNEVKKVVSDSMNTMADEMGTAVKGQEQGNTSATGGVKTTGGNMGTFINGS